MPTLTQDEVQAALRTLIENGLTFHRCTSEFSRIQTPAERIYAEWAADNLSREGSLEIEGGTIVSCGDDKGAYVLAWQWVRDDEIWTGPTDSEGDPCRFINRYHCEACSETWEDQWSCACNDKCPSCGAEIEPFESEELDLLSNSLQEAEAAN